MREGGSEYDAREREIPERWVSDESVRNPISERRGMPGPCCLSSYLTPSHVLPLTSPPPHPHSPHLPHTSHLPHTHSGGFGSRDPGAPAHGHEAGAGYLDGEDESRQTAAAAVGAGAGGTLTTTCGGCWLAGGTLTTTCGVCWLAGGRHEAGGAEVAIAKGASRSRAEPSRARRKSRSSHLTPMDHNASHSPGF